MWIDNLLHLYIFQRYVIVMTETIYLCFSFTLDTKVIFIFLFANLERIKTGDIQAKTDISVWDFWGTSRGGHVSLVRKSRRCPTRRRSRLRREWRTRKGRRFSTTGSSTQGRQSEMPTRCVLRNSIRLWWQGDGTRRWWEMCRVRWGVLPCGMS